MEDSYNTTLSLDYTGSDPNIPLPIYVTYWIVIILGLPLTLLAICALLFVVRNDHVAPIYVINLLISDFIQICCMIAVIATSEDDLFSSSFILYLVALMANIGFMVCIALERYLLVAWPLWYRFKRSIRVSVLVCVLVWLFPLVPVTLSALTPLNPFIIFTIFFLLPFPVLVFSVVGTLKSLSGVISVSSKEKRRIVGTLVLVLCNYTLLFLPFIIWLIIYLYTDTADSALILVSVLLITINPLADLVLYIFMGKGATGKLLDFLCRCRKDGHQQRAGGHVV